jgi:hypothetical protein
MKLRTIAESIRGSTEPLRQAAEVLGGLIQHVYGMGKSEELRALHSFLSKPSPRAWERTKWIVDSLSKKAGTDPSPETQDQMTQWAELGQMTSPVVSAAVFDLDEASTRGTPAQDIALSRRLRDDLKEALGPQGYIAALADMGEVSDREVKALLKSTARSGEGLRKAAEEDLPGVARKPVTKF